jgi:hypothetical protein
VVSDLKLRIVSNFKLSLFDDKFNLLKETNTMVWMEHLVSMFVPITRASKEEYKVKETSVV